MAQASKVKAIKDRKRWTPALVRAYFSMEGASRRKVAWILVISLGSAVSQGVSIGLLLPLLQYIQNDGLPQGGGTHWRILESVYQVVGLSVNLGSLLVSVLILITLAQALLYLQRIYTNRLREDFVADLRRKAFGSFINADVGFLQNTNRGTLVNAMTEETERSGLAIFSYVDLVSRVMLVMIYAGVLLSISWQTSLAGLGVILAGSLLTQFQIVRSRRLGKEVVDLNNQLHGFAVERFDGAREIKLNNAEDREQLSFRGLTGGLATVLSRYHKSAAQIRLILEPVITGGGLLIVFIGVVGFDVSLAQLAVFMYVLVRMAPEALQLNQHRHVLAAYMNSFDNVQRLMREASQRTTIVGGTRPFLGVEEGIALSGLSFSYNPSNPVLEDVSVTIPASKLTAIVGPSGAGKSTFLDLIGRLVDPSEGAILMDGVDVKEFDLPSLRKGIGVVSQDLLMFSDTVMMNIRYSYPEATDEEVYEAARRANADRFIDHLPKGYDTVLGHRGLTLSGGERQRLALARALLGDPSILLLDEVTSNLDAESERLIQNSIFYEAKDRTVIVVAHRLSMVERADKVIVLENGRVVEEGRPEDLSRGGGLFQYYQELQLGPR